MSTPAGPDGAYSVIDAVDAVVGGAPVRRALPTRAKRTIGAWCFLDHYGPDDVTDGPGMAVGPHPHIGLQTVTWLVEGEVVHFDSLGSEQPIRPSQLNVMTAGRGIAHAEESPRRHPPVLHGTQLWVALPDGQRHRHPAFAHHPQLPEVPAGGWTARVLVGAFDGASSPAEVFTPLLGVELSSRGPAVAELPLEPAFEHGVAVLEGQVTLDGRGPGGVGAPGGPIGVDRLVVAPPGRASWELRTDRPSRVLLLGGVPWRGSLVMGWNFVGATAEDVESARADWVAGRRFGSAAYDEVPRATVARIPAPPLPPGKLVSRS